MKIIGENFRTNELIVSVTKTELVDFGATFIPDVYGPYAEILLPSPQALYKDINGTIDSMKKMAGWIEEKMAKEQ